MHLVTNADVVHPVAIIIAKKRQSRHGTGGQAMTDRLISLQAAVDAGLRLCGRDTKAELINLCEASIADSEGWAGGILDYMGELEDLPSAQPEPDCVSRKTALDAFGLSEKTRKYGGDHSGYDTRMLYEIQDTLESLPAVQTDHVADIGKKAEGDCISRQAAIDAEDTK